MPVPSLEELLAAGVRGRRVFVRADLNVPLADGRIRDDSRIRASLPTLQKLLAAGARVVVASHLGRPKGERAASQSLRPLAPRLAELLDCGVSFCEDCVGDAARAAVAELGEGQLLLLENLRFHKGEEQNDPDFARALAGLCDDYVNDAFGSAHRAHASTTGMVAFAKRIAAGDLLRAELSQLRAVLEPARPLLVVLGGAKVSDKLAVLEALAPHADSLAIGGAMAYTFLAARGEPIGRSLVEPDRFEAARRVLRRARESGRQLLLPTDHVVAERLEPAARTRVVEQIPEDWIGVDIGPRTAERYAAEARCAATVFWNGPMGVFEIAAFAAGTRAVAAGMAQNRGITIVGGGDSLAAVNQLGHSAAMTHLSTGGGASLEFIQGLTLPGVAALERSP